MTFEQFWKAIEERNKFEPFQKIMVDRVSLKALCKQAYEQGAMAQTSRSPALPDDPLARVFDL